MEPTDKDALQTKLFLLLQTDQYSTALGLAESSHDRAYEYERAYSLYRLQRESEAADVLGEIKKQGGDDRGVCHLEAQLVSVEAISICIASCLSPVLILQNYRQGAYQNAFDLYNQLLDTAEPASHFRVTPSLMLIPKSAF